jgi:hypothetical protein
MISLIGGKYNGQYLNRDRLPVGDVVAIIEMGTRVASDAVPYRMAPDGCAYVVYDVEHLAWHAVAQPDELS